MTGPARAWRAGAGLALLLLIGPLVGCVGPLSGLRSNGGLSLEGRFVYRHYDAPRRDRDGDRVGSGLPLAIALDAEGNAWVLGEFHTDLQFVPAAGDSVTHTTAIPIPLHPEATPFTGLYGRPSQISVLGESVVVDDLGRVWLSQGGGYIVASGRNHSRVVSYEPGSGRFHAYNLPGNRNEAMGLLWDEGRGLLWVAESGMDASRPGASSVPRAVARAGAITAFDPETAPHDTDFAWDRSLEDQLCAVPRVDPQGCFARFPLPAGALAPAHLARDAEGCIWFTLFWGSAIGRLDPETGETLIFPLAHENATRGPAQTVGVGPWEIAISPDGSHVAWSEFFDSSVARMPLARALDPACRELRDGRNPCVEEARVPRADPSRQQVHSIAFDRFGNLWFTQASTRGTLERPSSVGFVTADWTRVELLAPFGKLRGVDVSYAGIAIDAETGDIWFSEFRPTGVGRLIPVDPDLDPATW